jgi:predicted GH43/DUF377 family glycosyl hydrolase
MLLRAVPDPQTTATPTGVIAAGKSEDGLNFTIKPDLAIVPDNEPEAHDAGGCEDPTVLIAEDSRYLVFYTGVDAPREQGCMMLAAGENLSSLVKQEVVIKAPKGEGNIKEAALARCSSGEWRLFYEYARDNASRIGLAKGPGPDGPWVAMPDPFTIREHSWDNWHLSTGPIVQMPGFDPVMFYNGATADARWRIGWISFDKDFTRVTGRGLEPVLVPPPAHDRTADDIAFAASTVMEGDLIALYFSIEDCTLRRALIRAYR